MPPTPPDAWTGGTAEPARPLRRWDGVGAPPREYTIDRRRHAVVQLPAANDIAARAMSPDTPDLDREEFYGMGETEPDETNVDLPWWAWAGITAVCAGLVAFAVVA